MRRICILQSAANEAAEAAAWYNLQRPGLGDEFQLAIDAALDLLEAGAVPLVAMGGSLAQTGVKRVILRRFPYDVIVREAGDELVVIAFAHHSRRPGYWRQRVTQ